MTKVPALSLILPMYNVRQYIVRCLQSIYAQPQIDKVEVILVDDGSPDDSSIVAENWLKTNAAIENWRIVKQENRGLGGARNTGLRLAKASFVWFVDTDDELLPTSLETVLPRLNEEYDMISFDYRPYPDSEGIFKSGSEVLKADGVELLKYVRIIVAWRSVYRRDFLLENELFFKEKFLHEDSEFSMRVNILSKLVAYYPLQIYLHYRNNADSIMNNIRLRNLLDMLGHFDSYNEIIEKYNPDIRRTQALQQSLYPVAYTMFVRSHTLQSADDWRRFKLELTKRKQLLQSAVSLLSVRNRMFMTIMLKCPYKAFYKWFFNVRLLR